jgi:uncharacterized protein DUF4407
MTDITVELPRVKGQPSFATVPKQRSDDRPVGRDEGLGVLPRRLVGIREEILDWVPEERARYTRLGLLLAFTGAMAAISLFVALEQVVEVPWIVLVPVALFWGGLVLAIDSWMVASTHGSLGSRRWLMFLPRLVMAGLLGSVIAEPFVLWIFHPAIETNVKEFQDAATAKQAGMWTKCNPPGGESTAGIADCNGYQLGIAGTTSVQNNLDSLEAERTKLDTDITTMKGQLDAKQGFAQDECAGVKRTGTSGSAGKGFRCDRAWKVATDFEKEIDLPAKRLKLASLDQQIGGLTGTLATDQQTHGKIVEEKIKAKVAKIEGDYGTIDIIDRSQGLERLSGDSNFVFSAQWLLRLLLIMVDCLPVLAKILGGTTSYDRLVHDQLQAGQRFYGYNLKVVEHSADSSAQQNIHRIDERSRAVQERHDEDLDAEIDRRAKRYAAEG